MELYVQSPPPAMASSTLDAKDATPKERRDCQTESGKPSEDAQM